MAVMETFVIPEGTKLHEDQTSLYRLKETIRVALEPEGGLFVAKYEPTQLGCLAPTEELAIELLKGHLVSQYMSFVDNRDTLTEENGERLVHLESIIETVTPPPG